MTYRLNGSVPGVYACPSSAFSSLPGVADSPLLEQTVT